MSTQATGLQERIASGKTILLAEIPPPQGADPAPLRAAAKRYAGKVHAVGVSDNRDRVAMSALAAASLLTAEGVEPILHVTTRDRNRIALVSEALGAQALGIRNLLCTSGTHQTLGSFRAARNVYDIDSVQLLQTYANLASDCRLLGESGMEGAGPFCLGAVASPDADPLGPAAVAARQEDAGRGEIPDHAAGLRPGAFRSMVARGHPAWPARAGRHPGRHPAALRRSTSPMRRRGPVHGREFPTRWPVEWRPRAIRVPGAPPPSRSRWRRSVGYRISPGCGGFASPPTATTTPPCRSSKNPVWGATDRACQVRPSITRRPRLAFAPWASWGSSTGEKTAPVATTA